MNSRLTAFTLDDHSINYYHDAEGDIIALSDGLNYLTGECIREEENVSVMSSNELYDWLGY